MRAWDQDGDFRAAIEADAQIAKYLTKEKARESFSVSRQLANIDQIFERVFQPS
jgi:adenylosuccinate lyase